MPVNAIRFIRKMRGGAQSHLLEADDGRYYIVKFQNNPQHRRILVNEWFAGEILSHLQIAAPEHAIVNLSADFLADNPEVYIQTGTRREEVKPGWHFGSRHPGNPNVLAIYDFIPDALLAQVANVEQFLGVLVFDRWVANADGRQSIFFRAHLNDWLAKPGIPPRKAGFVTLMVDHGFAFNGPHWDFPESAMSGLYPRRAVYGKVRSVEDFEPWLSRAAMCPEAVFDKALRQLPLEWIAEDGDALDRLLERLRQRQKRIGDLLLDCREGASSPFPKWTTPR
jgi:hypothetical protein